MTFTKEQLIAAAVGRIEMAEETLANDLVPLARHTFEIDLELTRIALASLEAEAVAYADPQAFHNFSVYRAGETDNKHMGREWMWANPDAGLIPVYTAPTAPANSAPVAWLWSHRKHASEVTLVRPEDDEKAEPGLWSGWSCQALYAAPPAPVSVPDELTREEYKRRFMEDDDFDDTSRGGWNACRAAMLQGAEPDFREISNSSTKHFRENAETSTRCWCHACRPVTFSDSRLVVCPECGNKRCPHANDHRNACTGSNEPGQEGGAYPATPQQEISHALAKGMERYGDTMQELAKKEDGDV